MHTQNGVGILIMQDDKFLHLGLWEVWKADFKQMRGCCNIEMCTLHLDEIMYSACYPSDIFYSHLKDIVSFI